MAMIDPLVSLVEVVDRFSKVTANSHLYGGEVATAVLTVMTSWTNSVCFRPWLMACSLPGAFLTK